MIDEPVNNKSLFRENAIKGLNNHTSQPLLILVKPAAWFYVICMIGLLLILLAWGVLGTVELTIPALGMIVREEDFSEAEQLMKDNIVEHQDKLTMLQELFSKQKLLYAKHFITINELEKSQQDYLNAKSELALLSNQNSIALPKPLFHDKTSSSHSAMDALLFVSHSAGKKIKSGMNVYVLPNSLTAYEYGYIQGEVVNVSDYPVTKVMVNSFLGNMNLVEEFFQGSTPFMIKVRLKPNKKTASGLSWTSRKGTDFNIEAGTTITARIVNRIASPLSLITTHRYS